MKKQKEIEKNIRNYKVKFKTSYDQKKSDYINLNISINEELRKIIEDVCIQDLIEYKYYDGEEYIEKIRKKVKIPIYSGITCVCKEIIFDINLLEKKEIILSFKKIESLENYIGYIKQSIKQLIEIIERSKIDIEINYNIYEK